MITPQTYINSISARLIEKFPDDPHDPYENQIPVDFKRPATFVDCEATSFRPCGLDSADVPMTFVIRGFTEVDDRHHSDYSELYERMMIICGAFIGGVVPLTDPADGHKRTAKIKAMEGRCYADYTEIRMTTELQMDITEFEEVPEKPMMEQIHTIFKA